MFQNTCCYFANSVPIMIACTWQKPWIKSCSIEYWVSVLTHKAAQEVPPAFFYEGEHESHCGC